MTRRDKIILFFLGVISSIWGLLDLITRALDAPNTVRTVWDFVSRMLSEFNTGAAAFLAFGALCFAAVTANVWWPWLRSWLAAIADAGLLPDWWMPWAVGTSKPNGKAAATPTLVTEAEYKAHEEIGRCIEEQLLPVLRQRGALRGKLIAAADGHIGSLVANLEQRGCEETLQYLEELRLAAADAFGNLKILLAANKRFGSIFEKAPAFAHVHDSWWAGFNQALASVRDLPPSIARGQIERFVQVGRDRWAQENRAAIVWADSFVEQIRTLSVTPASAGAPDWPQRISIVDLAALAEAKHGWKTQSGESFEVLDFNKALWHAAHDGQLVIEGRLGCVSQPEYRKDDYLFHKIPTDHWETHRIDAPWRYRDANNFKITTYGADGPTIEDGNRFCDLHVSDRNRALVWLEMNAAEWKGRTAKAEQLRGEASAKWQAEMREQGFERVGDPDSEQGARWIKRAEAQPENKGDN